MSGDTHVRFCERFRLKCLYLLDPKMEQRRPGYEQGGGCLVRLLCLFSSDGCSGPVNFWSVEVELCEIPSKEKSDWVIRVDQAKKNQ